MTTKINETDEQRREQIKELTGIKLSDSVRFYNYTLQEYIYEEYDNAVSYTIFTKIKIKEKELNKLLDNSKFFKQSKSDIPPGLGYDCGWWRIDESNVTNFYKHPHSLQLTKDIQILTVWQYIIVTSEKDSDGYVTVYLQLA